MKIDGTIMLDDLTLNHPRFNFIMGMLFNEEKRYYDAYNYFKTSIIREDKSKDNAIIMITNMFQNKEINITQEECIGYILLAENKNIKYCLLISVLFGIVNNSYENNKKYQHIIYDLCIEMLSFYETLEQEEINMFMFIFAITIYRLKYIEAKEIPIEYTGKAEYMLYNLAISNTEFKADALLKLAYIKYYNSILDESKKYFEEAAKYIALDSEDIEIYNLICYNLDDTHGNNLNNESGYNGLLFNAREEGDIFHVKGEGTVYCVPDGRRYHRIPNCVCLSQSDKIFKGKLSDIKQTKTACNICFQNYIREEDIDG